MTEPPHDPPPPETAPADAPPSAETAPAGTPADASRKDGKPPWIITVRSFLRGYFLGEDPTLSSAIVPMCFLSMLLYTRNPVRTNFIFDEQEALLANPYVRSVADPTSHLRWVDAFYRDFWGLTPDRTIGSYRPLPDLIWRALWALGARDQTPFLHHWINVLLHGVNGALLVLIVMRVTKNRGTAWLAGVAFTACAVVTEAVSGVVGLADVLGGLGALLALCALALPMWGMPLALFGATLLGLYSKESALCIVPLVPFAALLMAHVTHPKRPMRWARMGVALTATMAAFVLYVEARKRMFPTPTPPELLPAASAHKGLAGRTFAGLLRWYAQPGLPKDPLNNPLVKATPSFRTAGALRVYWRGLTQVVFPWTLSGDYSAPQEPIPKHLVFPESVLGALMMVGPMLASLVVGVRAMWRAWKARLRGESALLVDYGAIAAVAMTWIVVSYFPVSNIPLVLPTVRAERFWYFPAIGSSVLVAIALHRLLDVTRAKHLAWAGIAFVGLYFGMQSFSARRHADDYADDLTFWDATRHAVPNSAKAHLNYSVMQGARGNLEERRKANLVALKLAPEWPMANVYLGDTLCRMHRAEEAWPHYKRGFELGPNDLSLIALGLQCMWDEKDFDQHEAELEKMGAAHPGSWLDYLQRDVANNGEKNNGVDPKYRPRGYNEGPKKD